MLTFTKSTRSKLEYSKFPLRVALPPLPPWKRRNPNPGPGSGKVEKRCYGLRLVRRSAEEDCGGN